MNVVFRTDSSFDIGTGHLMRCLTLADALHEFGARSRFVCRAHRGNLCDLVRQRGHDVFVLPPGESSFGVDLKQGEQTPAHAAWLGARWETDASQTFSALCDLVVDWLVVDHYALDARWERALRAACGRLMVIDDLADRMHVCDVLLDQNVGHSASDYDSLVSAGCRILVGPQYALLRPEFSSARDTLPVRRGEHGLKQLLISMGGVDQNNATSRVLVALETCPLPAECRIVVVMGPNAPWLTEVWEKARLMTRATKVLVNVKDMATLMRDSDLAISSAGTTALESCSLGLPSILMVLADNQKGGAFALEAAGAALLLGDGVALEDDLATKVQLCCREGVLEEMGRRCQSLAVGSEVGQLLAEIKNADQL